MSHGGGDDDDIGQQAWPGFVDILSSVLIMFVFFLMITATALYFHTLIFKSKIIKNNDIVVKEIVKKQLDSKIQTIMAENQMLKDKIEQYQQAASPTPPKDVQLMAQTQQLTPDQLKPPPQKAQPTEMAESKNQTTQLIPAEKAIVVFFEPDGITLTDKTKAEVTQFFAGFNPAAIDVTVISSKNTSDTIDMIARKVTVARLLNVRNGVMQAKVPPDHIAASMVDSGAINGNLDWVKIIVKDKGSKS